MKKIFYIFALAVITMTSCEKNEVKIQDEAQKWVELQNNKQLITLLNQLDSGKELSELIPNVKFHSMWDLYQEILNANEIKQKELIEKYPNVVRITNYEEGNEIKLNLNDKTLAKLLSAEGFIKIGKRIINVDGDVIKVITNGDKTLIPELEKTIVSNCESNIVVEKITSYKEKKHFEPGIQKMVAIWGNWEYYDSTTRCHWEKWIDYNPVFDYATVGAEVTNQRKSWLGWANWFSSSSYMYLHLRSDYLDCTNFSYGVNLLDDPGIDLYDSGNTTNVSVSKRFSDSGNVESGHIEIDFIYRGTTYYH